MTIEAQRVLGLGAQLGEGPVWVARDQALWFVDIEGQQLYRYHPRSGRVDRWTSPDRLSFVLPAQDGGFVTGLRKGLHRFSPQSGSFDPLLPVELHLPDNRLNDACVDPHGTLWFGTMHDLETQPSGMLYQLHEARLLMHDSGYVVSNGPAFSPDGRTFYHTDSENRTIYAFDRASGGPLSNKRILIRLQAADGYPDGTTVDAEGALWVALWGGWAVRRYSPQGVHLATVPLPCARVTKVAFGGDDLRTGYVTTACKGLSSSERAAQPHAGDLFAFRSPVAGLPVTTLNH